MTREEAINEIKSWAIPSKKGREVLETLIPELCESEDERIRKVLVNEISGWSDVYKMFKYAPKEKVLAWLEKQKEPIDPFDTKLFQDGVKEGRRLEREDIMKEQKPADDEAKAIAYREYERGRESGLRDGQKYVLDNAESYGLCKPVEWSEEDEKIRRNLMSLLANMRGDRITEETYQKYYPWLKDLHSSWKPSKEQMKALYCALNDAISLYSDKVSPLYEEISRTHFDALESLYNDLKKL